MQICCIFAFTCDILSIKSMEKSMQYRDQKPKDESALTHPNQPSQNQIESSKLNTPNSTGNKPRAVEDAKKQKFDAAAEIATGADTTVTKVLKQARQIADKQLEPQIAELAKKLAPRMVSNELGQAEAIVNFFIEEWGNTNRVLKPYEEVLEAEVLTL